MITRVFLAAVAGLVMLVSLADQTAAQQATASAPDKSTTDQPAATPQPGESPEGEGSAATEVVVELNRLEESGENCKSYFISRNLTEMAFERLRLDLVLFDAEEIVLKALAIEAAPIAAGKTKVNVFEIDGVACDSIARILLNQVAACIDANGERRDCDAAIELTSRTDAAFEK